MSGLSPFICSSGVVVAFERRVQFRILAVCLAAWTLNRGGGLFIVMLILQSDLKCWIRGSA